MLRQRIKILTLIIFLLFRNKKLKPVYQTSFQTLRHLENCRILSVSNRGSLDIKCELASKWFRQHFLESSHVIWSHVQEMQQQLMLLLCLWFKMRYKCVHRRQHKLGQFCATFILGISLLPSFARMINVGISSGSSFHIFRRQTEYTIMRRELL